MSNFLRLNMRVVVDYGRAAGSPGAYQDLTYTGRAKGFGRVGSGEERVMVRGDATSGYGSGVSWLPYTVVFQATDERE